MHPRRSLFFVAPATPAGSTASSASPVHRPSGISPEANQAPRPCFSRDTNHETRNTAFLLFSLLSCALWRGMGRLWRGMGGHHPPHRQNGLYRRRTAVPAARSRLPCSRLFAIVRHCSPLFTINLNGGGPEQVSAHRQPFSVGLPSRAVSPQLPPLSRLLGLWLPRMGPMPGKRNALGCANRGTFSAALTAGLLFSPPGEAKCVRGPSGRGEHRLARAGVLDSTSSTASKRNEVMAVVSCASTVGW